MNPSSSKLDLRNSVILTHAVSIFARDGYSRADVQTIADLAGVGKGTVYRHFGNKEQLFWASSKFCMEQLNVYIGERIHQCRSQKLTVATDEAHDFLRRIACVCAEFYQSHPEAIEILIQSQMEFRESASPARAAIKVDRNMQLLQLISAVGESGFFADWDAEAVSNAFADLFYGSLVNGYLNGNCDLVKRIDDAMQILLYGIIHPQKRPLHSEIT